MTSVCPAAARETLTPLTSTSLGQVTLTWTAPGDDQHLGRAAAYDVRYSPYPIDATNFVIARRAFMLAPPQAAGTQEYFTIGSLLPLQTYYFAIKSVDDAGNWSGLSNVVQQASAITVSTEDAALPLAFSKPYPNPARARSRMELSMPVFAEVRIDVFDVGGRRVRTLFAGTMEPGRKSIEWNLDDATGRRVSPGIYLVQARLGSEEFRRRIVVTR
jgi:hypothetical protein